MDLILIVLLVFIDVTFISALIKDKVRGQDYEVRSVLEFLIYLS